MSSCDALTAKEVWVEVGLELGFGQWDRALRVVPVSVKQLGVRVQVGCGLFAGVCLYRLF